MVTIKDLTLLNLVSVRCHWWHWTRFDPKKLIADFPNETPKFEATSRNLSGDLGEDDDDEEGDGEEEEEDEEVVTNLPIYFLMAIKTWTVLQFDVKLSCKMV